MNTQILLIVSTALNVALIVYSILAIFIKAIIIVTKAIAKEYFKANFRGELCIAFICTFGAIYGGYFLL